MDKARQEKLDKFNTSRQEPVRLDIALEEFFRPELESAAKEIYGAYLKRRLRPAAAALIDREDVVRLEALRRQRWLTLPLVDESIDHARRGKRTASLIWLLSVKDKDFGWQDRDFSL